MACKGLDAQVVRPDDTELAQLLDKFVLVRITNFKPVDMNRFKFDYDLTFAVLMMDADGRTYSRFGTQDYKSLSDRMSIAGLKRAMRDVLAQHSGGTRERSAKPNLQPTFTLMSIPAYARSKQAGQECAHCHFANNFRFRQLQTEGKFRKDMLFQYPLPDNVGVILDVDANNVVKRVLPDSPAWRAGVQAGDVIAGANGAEVFTSADLQFALDPILDPGQVALNVLRDGKAQPPLTLRLPAGWRRTDISWRASQGSVSPSVGIWGEPLNTEQRHQRGLQDENLALKVTFLFPGPVWAKSRGGLSMGDVITGVNGAVLPSMTARQFHAYFRTHFSVGDSVTLNVLRGEQKLDLKAPCIETNEE